MAYKVIILYQLYMPSYFLGTFTEYPFLIGLWEYLFKKEIQHFPEKSLFAGNGLIGIRAFVCKLLK